RCVKVRIYLDGGRLGETAGSKAFRDLVETPGIEIRTKAENSALMHLKSYEIDGRVLPTGAANFSASGLEREDDDLETMAAGRRCSTHKKVNHELPRRYFHADCGRNRAANRLGRKLLHGTARLTPANTRENRPNGRTITHPISNI